MLVVSNTSPLLNLAIIGHLELLYDQVGDVLVPGAVVDELRLGEPLPGVSALVAAFDQGWLKVVGIENQPLVQVLERSLDRGESEAIALAIQVRADALLLDERDGRRVARSLGVPVIGILGILLRAKLAGRVLSLGDVLTDLERRAHFRIAADLKRQLLGEAGEGQGLER